MKYVIKKALFRLKTNFYENGEKNGQLLARQLKCLASNNIITAIRNDDKLFTSANTINDVFKYFYKDLYTSTCSAGDEDLNSFQKVELPQLPSEEKDSMLIFSVHFSQRFFKERFNMVHSQKVLRRPLYH